MGEAAIPQDMALVQSLAEAVRDRGVEIGLPYIAASADIGDPEPMRGADGRPFVETLFHWMDPGLEYWKDRAFALRSAFVFASRYSAEPFFYCDGRFGTWRPVPRLENIEVNLNSETNRVGTAIVCPAHLPGGVIGAIVWGSGEVFDIRPTFHREALALHGLTLKFLAAYNDLGQSATALAHLTRREIQCLKWAAAGKTDAEIAQIVEISTPTVRFHMRNAAEKLAVTGRSQAVHRASVLGYIGERRTGRALRT
jgi:DNA-binding CsgD family transcriptional regulator